MQRGVVLISGVNTSCGDYSKYIHNDAIKSKQISLGFGLLQQTWWGGFGNGGKSQLEEIGFLLWLNEQTIESSSAGWCKNKPTIGLFTSHGLVQIERQIRCADKDTTILSKNEQLQSKWEQNNKLNC